MTFIYLECHSSTRVFQKKSQLLGLPVSGTLVENGLKKHVKKWIGFQKTATVQVKKENTTFT